MKNFQISSALKAPHPHLPVQIFISPFAKKSIAVNPVFALTIYRRVFSLLNCI